MRILHLVHQYMPDYVGGTELYTQWLAEHLSQRGHRVAVFYRRSGQGATLDKRVDAHEVQVWAATAGLLTPRRRFLATFGDASLLTAFQAAITESQPDLVHLQHLMGLPLALVDYLQQVGLPYIITLHDYWWVCANAQLLTNYSQALCNGPQAYLNCARCALARAGRPQFWPALPGLAGLLAWRNRRLRQVLQSACRLIAPTQFVAGWYAAHGAPAEKLQTIPHGLPLPPQIPRPETRPERPFRFAYIGGLTPQKGVHCLVAAFNTLASDATLWIAGDEMADPDYAAWLRREAAPTVRFLGRLSRAQVWEVLAQVDVVVVPSVWYETFSFIISEAFAAGVPVIASALGPLAERINHAVNGFLVPPGDIQALCRTMGRFLAEPVLLSQLQAGIGPPQTIEAYTEKMIALYQAVLSGGGDDDAGSGTVPLGQHRA